MIYGIIVDLKERELSQGMIIAGQTVNMEKDRVFLSYLAKWAVSRFPLLLLVACASEISNIHHRIGLFAFEYQ